MDSGDLFIRTLSDLEKRTTSTDEYEVLLSALLIRKLLLDAVPLMDKVNSSVRLKVHFRINGETAYERIIHEDGPIFWSLEDGIDPEIPMPPGLQAPFDATRDQFLARRVLRANGNWFTVRDLIDQLAHIEGAVHSRDPKDQREQVLKETARSIYIGSLPAGVRQVQSISRVVVRALTPLATAISSGPSLSRLLGRTGCLGGRFTIGGQLRLSWPGVVCSSLGNRSMSAISSSFWHAAGTVDCRSIDNGFP